MGLEIERKFLVKGEDWQSLAERSERYTQAYLANSQENTVRVRLTSEKAWLTIKGPRKNLSSAEFEYSIPHKEALDLLALCRLPPLKKTRFFINYQGDLWSVDRFEGHLQGLLLAEIELTSANQSFTTPPWLDLEVSDDPRYRNSSLAALTHAKIINGRLT